MRKITLIMAYYENPGMLEKQQEIIGAYPKEILENLDWIIIDDCSPEHPASEVFKKIPEINDMRLYRTEVDVPWNQDFCRNLGASEANTGWLFLTDIDHLVPLETMRILMTEDSGFIKVSESYRFTRRDYPGNERYKIHPNSWFMTKELYEKIGGYDERFAGYYGTDGDFRDRLKKIAKIRTFDFVDIIRVGREHIPDASTTTYQRKKPEDGVAIRKIKAARCANAKPHNLTFRWERLI